MQKAESCADKIKLDFNDKCELATFDFQRPAAEDKSKRILYMGSPDFSLPPLQRLVEEGYNLVAVATQPDRPVGRKQCLTATPAKIKAQALGLPVYNWEKLSEVTVRDDLEVIRPELIITAAYGNILPRWVLDFPPYGCLNIHPSLLPKWRGASPVASSILAGDKETALSIMEMGEGLDDGDIVAVCRCIISDEHNQETLTAELAEIAADLVTGLLPYWFAGILQTEAQDDRKASYAKKLSRRDGLLDFKLTARENFNKVRALYPWPTAYTYYEGKRYKVYRAHLAGDTAGYQTGEVVRRDKELLVACSDGLIGLDLIQGPNGKKVAAHDCYHNFAPGTFFEQA